MTFLVMTIFFNYLINIYIKHVFDKCRERFLPIDFIRTGARIV